MNIIQKFKRLFTSEKNGHKTDETIFIKDKNVYAKEYKLIVILRVRNESLILEDTLNHLSTFCDGIVAYDDDSTDNTLGILKSYSKVLAIIQNHKWKPNIKDRQIAETSHRESLLSLALTYSPEWIFCADADERYVGDIRTFVNSSEADQIDGVRLSLYDAYLTPEDQASYKNGVLLNFRKYFGLERRDILMLWKASSKPYYKGKDQREPFLKHNNIIVKFQVQHYGKGLSEQHWEDTCDYYIKHFPFQTYGKKWQSRKGKAIHTQSDFGTQLYPWGTQLFENSICIHPVR